MNTMTIDQLSAELVRLSGEKSAIESQIEKACIAISEAIAKENAK